MGSKDGAQGLGYRQIWLSTVFGIVRKHRVGVWGISQPRTTAGGDLAAGKPCRSHLDVLRGGSGGLKRAKKKN